MKKIYFLIAIFMLAVPFSLNAQCSTPTGLSATNITNSGAYIYLNPTSTNVGVFNIRYHLSNTTNAWVILEHVALPYQLANLGCSSTYEWQAQQVCTSPAGTTSVSDWSLFGTFTTSICTAPPPLP